MREQHFMKQLDVDRWRALYLNEKGEEVVEEKEAVRWEQWFVSGDLHVYTWREKDGDWSSMGIVEDHDAQSVHVFCLEDLCVFVEEGDDVHPVLMKLKVVTCV
jgi:hypothetical protein